MYVDVTVGSGRQLSVAAYNQWSVDCMYVDVTVESGSCLVLHTINGVLTVCTWT